MIRFTTLLCAFALVACGDDGSTTNTTIDAAIDTPSDSPGPDGPSTLTCANYCSTITTNCTTANTMYASQADCMNTCSHFAPGTVADLSGNTLGCRVYHAGMASANPGLHCRHAGPGGDGPCGTNCEGFCTLVLGACAAQATPPYASMSACMTSCSAFAPQPSYSAAVMSGNSLACRLYHATAASTTPTLHCSHTAAAAGAGAFPCQ